MPAVTVLVRIRLFGPAREAAGTSRDELEGETVDEVLAAAVERYGRGFASVLATCQVWVNGDTVDAGRRLQSGDEVALLPPISGGSH